MCDNVCNNFELSAKLYERAQRVLVGGVNSPVRAFGAVGGDPVFVARAEGPYIIDVDDNRYIDLVGSWGPAIVGHAHPEVVDAVQRAAADGLSFGACHESESQLAQIIIDAIPSIERVRFVSSGTEATMSAIRLARAITNRPKILKFAGGYHGHADSMLVSAGSGAATHGVPNSPGVPASVAADTLVAPYNDLLAVEAILAEHEKQLAAILVEPIAGNMGMAVPIDGFLEGLRALCDKHRCLLIFDEVMTGFRVAWGGYQQVCGIKPDLTCLGKVIGGGMPVAAYGGSATFMKQISPEGPVYQAGTLSGNPLAMAAGIATLELCRTAGFYDKLHRQSTRLTQGWLQSAKQLGVAIQTAAQGGMIGLAFSDRPIRNFEDAQACDQQRYARFFHAMLDRGVWLPPSSYEALFLSSAHNDEVLTLLIEKTEDALRSLVQ